jgi:hypothetical protein
MKLNFFLASNSETESPKMSMVPKMAMVKKLVKTVTATVVMGAATLLFTSFNTKTSPQLAVPADAEEVAAAERLETPPRGLTRQRTDFEKAISILAQGAQSNAHLADYYTRVQKRIQGQAAKHESGSGVRAVKVSRKINPPSDPKSQVADTRAAYQEKAPDGLKGLAESEMIADSEAAPEARIETLSAVSETRVSQGAGVKSSRLAIGDIVYDTNPAIDRWVNWYTATPGGRRTMTIGIERSSAYLRMARAEFRKAGLPEDLVWLAHVESVWNPNAVSPAAAGGLWQFIPKTAIEYGLTVASGNDERTNPLKQTRVAAEYLHDLYTIFGDWALAMAAYNTGEPRVMEAIVKNGRANFWELYERQLLPKETRDYVPKILAAIKVADLANSYGLMPGLEAEEATLGR